MLKSFPKQERSHLTINTLTKIEKQKVFQKENRTIKAAYKKVKRDYL